MNGGSIRQQRHNSFKKVRRSNNAGAGDFATRFISGAAPYIATSGRSLTRRSLAILLWRPTTRPSRTCPQAITGTCDSGRRDYASRSNRTRSSQCCGCTVYVEIARLRKEIARAEAMLANGEVRRERPAGRGRRRSA